MPGSEQAARSDIAVHAIHSFTGGHEATAFLAFTGQVSHRDTTAGKDTREPDAVKVARPVRRGADGKVLRQHGVTRRRPTRHQRCQIPYDTIGTWTTKIARLPVSGGWHALVFTKTAEFSYEKDSFLLLAQSEEEAPALHHRFLDKRSPLPLHGSWAGWLWERGLNEGEIVPLQSVGISAYRCSPKADRLREDLSDAVASGGLTLPGEESDGQDA